jgi:hypothetical protein
MGLETLIGRLFPQKRFDPAQAQQPTPTVGGFYPGMNGTAPALDADGNDNGSPAFVPQRSVDAPQPNPEMAGKSSPVFGAKPQPQMDPNSVVPAQQNAGFYPGMNGATEPAATAVPTPTAAPNNYVDPATAYQENGGTPLDTPAFYPGGQMTKKQARRAQQNAKDDAFNSLPLEEKQQKLLAGEGPAEHSLLRRLGEGALRGLARGGLGGAVTGAAVEGFFPGMNREQNAQDELPKVNAQIAAKNAAIKTDQDQQYRKAQTETIYNDDKQHADALKEKTDMDNSRVRYWNRKADQGDLKLASADELMQLRDKWMTSKDANDKRRLDTVDKELTERQRHNQVTEKQAATNETGRNARSNTSISAANSRQTDSIKAAADRVQAQISAADDRQKQSLLTGSLNKWKALHTEATPEDEAAAEAQIRAQIYGKQQ